jgi:hypothetical protein
MPLKSLLLLAWLNGSSLSDMFLNLGATQERAYRVSRIIVHQSMHWGTDPLLIGAIISVENPRLISGAVSTAGATGVMQIMPGWTTSGFRGCGSDLTQDKTNVCYGVRVWQFYRATNVGPSRALLAYNGCVRKPGCERYAPLVWNQYMLFRYQAKLVRERSWFDNVIWRMSERHWAQHFGLAAQAQLWYSTSGIEVAGGGRRSARGAPRGERCGASSLCPSS